MCLWWADFPIYTAPMRGSCVTAAVLFPLFALYQVAERALVLCCQLFCFVTGYVCSGWCLVGCRYRSDSVLYCSDFRVYKLRIFSRRGISPEALIYVDVGTCSAVSCVLCAAGVFVPRSGWGTALQTGRSRDRFPKVSEFFIDIILPAALWPWGRLSL
jgi:hypothetical protein